MVAVADQVAAAQLLARNRRPRRLLLVCVARDEPSEPPMAIWIRPEQSMPVRSDRPIRTGSPGTHGPPRPGRRPARRATLRRPLRRGRRRAPSRGSRRPSDPDPAVLVALDGERFTGQRLRHLLRVVPWLGPHRREPGHGPDGHISRRGGTRPRRARRAQPRLERLVPLDLERVRTASSPGRPSRTARRAVRAHPFEDREQIAPGRPAARRHRTRVAVRRGQRVEVADERPLRFVLLRAGRPPSAPPAGRGGRGSPTRRPRTRSGSAGGTSSRAAAAPRREPRHAAGRAAPRGAGPARGSRAGAPACTGASGPRRSPRPGRSRRSGRGT